RPLVIRMHAGDNVAIVANDGGLPAGIAIPDGPVLREHVPQGHKVALADLAAGEAVRRYDVTIGTALEPLPAGSWVNERRLAMPTAPELSNLPVATRNAPRSEEHTSELQSRENLVCRLLLEKKRRPQRL